MSERPDLRVSDADRERAAAALSAHYAAGRLDDQELDERLNAAYAARTESQLRALSADLPPLPLGQLESRAQWRARRRQLQQGMLQHAGGGLCLFVICTAVWASSGADAFFWPVLVLLVVLIPLLRVSWALYGPAPDLDRAQAELERRARHGSCHADRQARIAERRYTPERRW